jgi:hypothetical protein
MHLVQEYMPDSLCQGSCSMIYFPLTPGTCPKHVWHGPKTSLEILKWKKMGQRADWGKKLQQNFCAAINFFGRFNIFHPHETKMTRPHHSPNCCSTIHLSPIFPLPTSTWKVTANEKGSIWMRVWPRESRDRIPDHYCLTNSSPHLKVLSYNGFLTPFLIQLHESLANQVMSPQPLLSNKFINPLENHKLQWFLNCFLDPTAWELGQENQETESTTIIV